MVKRRASSLAVLSARGLRTLDKREHLKISTFYRTGRGYRTA
jgi:hypothetical protein